MENLLRCFEDVGEGYSYDQCCRDYYDFLKEMYAYEARMEAMDHESNICDTKEAA